MESTSSNGVVLMRGNTGARYIADPNATIQGRPYLIQQESGTMKRTMPSGGYSGMVKAPSRFMTNSRLISTNPAPSPVQNSYHNLKKTFAPDYQHEYTNSLRKFPRTAEKSKGLRHFSTKVCEKVKEKGRTNYNEVADELVNEYFDSISHIPVTDSEKHSYDMKNIRRRVYDALNVLMAMNIIEKEKKEIRWVGLPTSSYQECKMLEDEKMRRGERIKEKTETLYDLVMQLVAYKSLVERNRERERTEGRPPDNTILYLPYVVVNTDKRTIVECNISQDKSEYVFNFDHPFEIQDDIEVLKRLGFAQGLDTGDITADLRPKINKCLPQALRKYVDPIIQGAFGLRAQRQPERKPIVAPSHPHNRPVVSVRVPARPRYAPIPITSSAVRQFPNQRYGSNMVVRTNPPRSYPGYSGVNGAGPSRQIIRNAPTAFGQEYMDEMYDEEEENVDYE